MPIDCPTPPLSVERRRRHAETLALKAACALGTVVIGLTSSMALSQENPTVELHAVDKSAVVRGELSEISDGSYVVKTALGTFRIGLDEAECQGDACPRLDEVDPDFSIQAATDAMSSLTVALLSGYAEDLGAEYRINDAEDGRRVVEILADGSGKQLASVDLRTADGSISNSAASDGTQNELQVFPELDPLGKWEIIGPVHSIGLTAHIGLPCIRTYSRPPPVSFSPPKAPPISAPLVPMFTLAMPQSDPLTERNRSASCKLVVKIELERP